MTSLSPLGQFFSRHRFFDYDPQEPASIQWKRLCSEKKFDEDDFTVALSGYKTALVLQFNESYGVDDNSLTAWHALLLRVDVTDPPDTVQECKELIAQIHVNLVDLVEAGGVDYDYNVDGGVRKFDTEEELAGYTIDTKKFFPRENAYAGNLLKYLLRQIVGMYMGDRSSRGSGRGRRGRWGRGRRGRGRGRGRGGRGGQSPEEIID